MRVPEETINKIIEKLDIVDLISQYTSLTKKGTRYWGLCPFHQEKTPSFSVTPEKGVFYCFGCQKGGSALTFLMEIEKLSFPEALQLAAQKTGISLNYYHSSTNSPNRTALLELYSKVANVFSHFLNEKLEGQNAYQYLLKRKIDESTQKKYRLGWAPLNRNWLYQFLIKKNYSKEFLEKSALFTPKGHAYFYKRLIFPIQNSKGEIIAFGGRSLDQITPKYLNSPETAIFHKGHNLYGLYQALTEIKTQNCCYVVEGYMDVLALNQAGLNNVVAPLGTAITLEQLKLLKRYCSKIIITFDADEAGYKATIKAIELAEDLELNCEVVEISSQKDPAEIFEKEGSQSLKKVLNYSINSFDYILKTALSRYNAATPEGKLAVLFFLKPYLNRVSSKIKRAAYLEKAADILSVRIDELESDLSRLEKGGILNSKRINVSQKFQISDELYLLLAGAINFEYFKEIRKQLRIDDLEDLKAKELFIAMEECYRAEIFSLDFLMGRIEDQTLKNLILEKASSEEFSLNPGRLIKDTLIHLQTKSLERKKKALLDKIVYAEKQSKNEELVRELQLELMYLDDELNKLKVRDYGRE